ncbi:MAG TPA: molybdopterin-dependent oxidoreductase [Propionicimonas sp.]|nr:molybdopterin-dependent oxidoreductase [Propionicimonas sp.]
MSRTGSAVAGIAAAALGAAAGQLVALIVNPAAAPIVAVGAAIVDLVPTPLKEWAVTTFGTNDKAVLIATVVVGVAVLSAVAGILGARWPNVGYGVFAAVGLVGILAAATRPTSGSIDWLPSVVGTVVAMAVLRLELRWLADRPGQGPDTRTGIDRRVLLTGAAGVVAATATAAVSGGTPAPTTSTPVTLPTPATPAPPLPAGLEATVPDISALRTPIEDFYRIDTALVLPRVSTDTWTLQVDGMVAAPFQLTWAELLAMPVIERDITLTCVSNEIGGPYCGSTRFTGVRVADLLSRAQPDAAADQVLSYSVDGFTASTPLAVLLDGRDAMIAIAMDSQPLTQVHGFPARLVTPGLYGYVGATKWLSRLKVTTFAADEAYWTQRGWSELGPVKTATRIDTPRERIAAGRTVIAGVAWATHRGVGKVEVQVDNGPWTATRLGPDVGLDYWRQWYLPWDAPAGPHRLSARAYDASGLPQVAQVQGVLPDGATGYHVVEVTVG